jgi:hypothetical protein
MGHVWFTGRIGVEPAISEADLDAMDDLAGPLDEAGSPWRVSEDRRELIPGEGGKFVEPYQEVLEQFARLLASRGYGLFGQVSWSDAHYPPHTGMVFARGAAVEWIGDRVVNPGPSWQPGEWVWDGWQPRHVPAEPSE